MKKLALLFLLPLSVLAQAYWDYPLFDRGHLAVNPSSNYYEFESARITVDRNLNFKSTVNRSLSTRIHNSYLNILEVKLLDQHSLDVEYLLLQNPQKFSKFKYGMSKIYNLSLN